MPNKIDGKAIADSIYKRLLNKKKPQKFFSAIIVGNDPASIRFVEQKRKAAEKLGIEFKTEEVSEEIKTEDLISFIKDIANDTDCGGVIVQLPLPLDIDRDAVIASIPREKDTDVLNKPEEDSDILPISSGVVKEILDYQGINPKGKKAAVVGKGFLIGQPVAEYLKKAGAIVSEIDKGDDSSPIKEADITVLGTGNFHLIDGDSFPENALIIDFGCSVNEEGRLCGDLDIEGLPESVSYTPTPGGTGPILVAKLFENFYDMN